jgi:hypothetical protein
VLLGRAAGCGTRRTARRARFLTPPSTRQAHWGKSGWHGWVYGWKLHLATTVAGVWIALAAHLTPANEADSTLAPLLEELPEEARFVLG